MQKIIRVGNSAAITLPKSVLVGSGVKIGTKVNVSYKEDLGTLVVDLPRRRAPTKAVIDKEVYATATDLLRRYLPAFKKLAHQ